MKYRWLEAWIGQKVRVYDINTGAVHVVGILTNVTKNTMRILKRRRDRRGEGVVFPRNGDYAIELAQ